MSTSPAPRAAAPARHSRSGAVSEQLKQTRATVADLQDLGYNPLPLRNWGDAKNRKAPARLRWTVDSYSPEEWEEGEHIGTRTGIQRDGLRFYVADIDSHEVYQDAPRFLATVQHRLRPELWAKLATALSTGRRGRYIAFRSTRELSNGTIRDDDGRKAGEFLGQGRHVVYITPDRWLQHDYARIPILDDTETDELLAALSYQPTMRDPEPKRPQDTVVDDSDVAFWRAHISLLLDERGLPPGLQRGQTFDLITGAVPVTNESDARFICLRGFLFMGFTPAEAIALAMHFCDWNRSGKDLYDDCARIVRKLTAVPNRWLTDYKISEASKQRAKLIGSKIVDSKGDTNSPTIQPAEPRGRGRPRSHPELKLLKHLQQDGIYGTFDDTNEMLAAALYQDVRTIKRWLVRLEQDGHIERRHAGRTRFIVLTPTEQGDTNSAPPAPAADSADTAPDRTPAQEISTREQPQQGTEETRVSSPPCAAPSLPGGGRRTERRAEWQPQAPQARPKSELNVRYRRLMRSRGLLICSAMIVALRCVGCSVSIGCSAMWPRAASSSGCTALS